MAHDLDRRQRGWLDRRRPAVKIAAAAATAGIVALLARPITIGDVTVRLQMTAPLVSVQYARHQVVVDHSAAAGGGGGSFGTYRENEPASMTDSAVYTGAEFATTGTLGPYDDWSGNGTSWGDIYVTTLAGAPFSDTEDSVLVHEIDAVVAGAGDTPSGGVLRTDGVFPAGSDTVYLDYWIQLSENWENHCNTTNKISWLLSPHGGGGDPYYMNAHGIVNPGATADDTMRWSMNIQGNVQNTSLWSSLDGSKANATDVPRGEWVHHEIVFTNESVHTADDATVTWWINGDSVAGHTGLDIAETADEADKFTFWKSHPLWGGQDCTLTEQIRVYVDHIYVSWK